MRTGFKHTLKHRQQDSLHALLNVLGEYFESRGYRDTGDAIACKQVFISEVILVKIAESDTHKLK